MLGPDTNYQAAPASLQEQQVKGKKKVKKRRLNKITFISVKANNGMCMKLVIMTSSPAFCCFLSVKKQKHNFHFSIQCIIKHYKQGLKAFDTRPEGASRPGLKGLKTLM